MDHRSRRSDSVKLGASDTLSGETPVQPDESPKLGTVKTLDHAE
jgi:hypothetical protein